MRLHTDPVLTLTKIFQNTLWFGVVPRITQVLNILLLPIITPHLTRSDYGAWGIVVSVTSITSTIALLGLNIHLTNSFYEYGIRFRKVWGQLYSLLIVSSIIFGLFQFIILMSILGGEQIYQRIVVSSIATIQIVFSVNSTIASHFYPLVANPRPFVVRNVISSLLGLFVSVSLIIWLKLGYLSFIIGMATTSILQFTLMLKPLWLDEKIRPIFSFKISRILKLLSKSLPIIPHSLGFVLLSQTNRIIMEINGVPIEFIGLFTNGIMLGDYVSILVLALVTAISPKMQTFFRNAEQVKYNKLYLFLQIVTSISVFIYSLWLPDIYDLLIRNPEFNDASIIARTTCFSHIVFPLYIFLSNIAFIEKRQYQLWWLVFVPGIISTTLNMVLIPYYGYSISILLSTFALWTIYFIPFVIQYYRKILIRWLGGFKQMLLVITINFSLILVSFFFAEYPTNTKLFFSLLVLAISSIVILNIRKHKLFV